MTTANPFPSHPPTAPASALDRSDSDVVLIVDDVPDNLAVLHDALDESGYTVLVAMHGEAALPAGHLCAGKFYPVSGGIGTDLHHFFPLFALHRADFH